MIQIKDTDRPLTIGDHLDHSYVDWAAVVGGALVAVVVFTS